MPERLRLDGGRIFQARGDLRDPGCRAPAQEQITVREEFDLTRSEIQSRVDAATTRALTEPERAALARYLAPSTHVIINDRIKALAASIVEGETNPVRAARKIYDWTFKNIDYWVKDPDHAIRLSLDWVST